MDITILKKIGLSDKEIKLYIKLLENGASSVRILAESAGLNRGTAYDILKNLQESGLVSFYHQDTKQKFVAEEPEKLLKLIKNKEQEINDAKDKINEIIPELKSLQDKDGLKPVTKFYEGKRAIKFILDDILASINNSFQSEYYVYSAPGVREDMYAVYPDFIPKRIKNKIKVKTISLSAGGDTYGLDERKWLSQTEEKSEIEKTYILIYANKCAFISRDKKKNAFGVIIENQMIYETQKMIFLQLWKLL